MTRGETKRSDAYMDPVPTAEPVDRAEQQAPARAEPLDDDADLALEEESPAAAIEADPADVAEQRRPALYPLDDEDDLDEI